MAAKRKPVEDDTDDYDDAGSASEVAAFKKGLSSIDLTTLRDHLSQRTITRKWKRDLVKAEYTQRTGENSDEGTVVKAVRQRLKTQNWGRWSATVIIVTCCLILTYTLYQFWQM
jgi:hypothetical protein